MLDWETAAVFFFRAIETRRAIYEMRIKPYPCLLLQVLISLEEEDDINQV